MLGQSSSSSSIPSKSASCVRLVRVQFSLRVIANICGPPCGTLVPMTWTSHVPCAGDVKVRPRRLSSSLDRFVHVPLGSFTAKSRSFTRCVEAAGVEAGSVHASMTRKSSAPLGTLKLHPRSSLVLTLSLSTKEALTAVHMSTRPQPSWSLGAVSPAPLVEELYWPAMSVEEAARMAFTSAEEGWLWPRLSSRC